MSSTINFDKVGRPLAKIEGGTLNGKIVSVAPQEEAGQKRTYKHVDLPAESKFQLVPNTTKEREIIYITGPSGSGKSTFTSNYIKEFKKKFKSADIYLFSALSEDEVLDKHHIKRIKLSASLISDKLTSADFEDALVIFDDIDVISDKKIREAVIATMNSILEVGRHFKTYCIITNHLSTAGKDTRRVLNEAHEIVYFPHSGSMKGINYLLKEYIGFDNKEIKAIKRLKSRWCCIFKNYPQLAMTERNLWLLAEDGDSDDEKKPKKSGFGGGKKWHEDSSSEGSYSDSD
jgi:energy-coupling factor transporter ATP-binding protein EcfA2